MEESGCGRQGASLKPDTATPLLSAQYDNVASFTTETLVLSKTGAG